MAQRAGDVTARTGWRNAGLVVVSLGCNAGLIGLMVLADMDRRPLPRIGAPVLYLDVEPRRQTPMDRDVASGAPPPSATRTVAAAPLSGTDADRSRPDLSTAPADPEQQDIDDRWRVGGNTSRAALPALSCDPPRGLSRDDRRRCDDRWTALGQDARAISGTGNAERDATFARHGARRLAAWEAQRAEPSRNATPCVELGPVVECRGVTVQVELFSTRDGLLPNLRKRRE